MRSTAMTPSFGLGASSLGNLFVEMTDLDAHAIVQGMWEGGIRSFDTAPHYGLGLSERRLGRALRGRPRAEFHVSTKVGRILEPNPDGAGRMDDEGFVVPAALRRRWDFSRDGVRRSIDESLIRLGLDRLDTVYLHDPEGHLDDAVRHAVPALVELRESGVVGAIGVGSKDAHALTCVLDTGAIDRAMVAGRYTLLEQPAARRVLPAALRHGTEVIAVGIYNSGLLATADPDPRSHYEYGVAPESVLERARRLARFCRAHGIVLPQAALHFPLQHPAVTGVMVGIGRPEQVQSTLEWMADAPPPEFWSALRIEGLVDGGDA